MVAAAYAAGIGGVYLFAAAPGAIAPAAAVLCVAGVGTAAWRRKARRADAGKLPATRFSPGAVRRGPFSSFAARITAAVVAAFVLGGAYCACELGKSDPLERFAKPPYNNAGVSAADEKDAQQSGSAAPDAVPRLTGRVLKYATNGKGTVRLTVSAGGRRLLVSASDKEGRLRPQDMVGRRVSFTGTAELPEGKANPGGFNYRLYLLTQGVRVIIKADAANIRLSEDKGGVLHILARFKYTVAERLEKFLPREKVAVITGLLFGMDDDIDEDTLTMFRENGVFHILSVSGMHVAILYAAVYALFGRRRTLTVCIVSLALLLCYAALSEFSETVMRAFAMIVIHIIAKLTRRQYDFLTGICAAGLFLLILRPMSLFNAGFQLSFLAVLLLAFSVPFFTRFTGVRYARNGEPVTGAGSEKTDAERFRRLGAVTRFLLPALCVQVGLTPVTAYMFNIVSPVALFANLPVAAGSGLLIPLGIVAFVIGALPLPEAVFGIMAKGMGVLTDFLTGSVELADKIPGNCFAVPSPPLWIVFAFYAALFILMSETFRLLVSRFAPALRDTGTRNASRRGIVLLFLAAGILTAMVAASPDMRQNRAALTFVDVGQGDCLHIRTPEGKNYLIDGGGQVDYDVGKEVLYEYLMKNGIGRLDGVFVTHLHTDHMKGIAELSRLMPVGDVFLSVAYRGREDEFLRECGAGAGKVIFLARGDVVGLDGPGGSVTARVV
ncbi:MAG: ComEC/Rec2 family competence protein, partial [Clostridiales Family XIII bacterium]|nr:ComEC/Rec2 family competence protein [Clostridiales Family XIII bacterium]